MTDRPPISSLSEAYVAQLRALRDAAHLDHDLRVREHPTAPGEWLVYGGTYADEGEPDELIEVGWAEFPRELAKLIAAAVNALPDLLDVVEAARHFRHVTNNGPDCNASRTSLDRWAETCDDAAAVLAAVLKKLEGRS